MPHRDDLPEPPSAKLSEPTTGSRTATGKPGPSDAIVRFLSDSRTERSYKLMVVMGTGYAILLAWRDPDAGIFSVLPILTWVCFAMIGALSLGETWMGMLTVANSGIVGVCLTTALLISASGGPGAVWASFMLLLVLLEPMLNAKNGLASLAATVILSVLDSALSDNVVGMMNQPLDFNLSYLHTGWEPNGYFRFLCLALLTGLLVALAMMVLPPLRSTSWLNFQRFADLLSATVGLREELASAIACSAACDGSGMPTHGAASASGSRLRLQAVRDGCKRQLNILGKTISGAVEFELMVWPGPLTARHAPPAAWAGPLKLVEGELQRTRELALLADHVLYDSAAAAEGATAAEGSGSLAACSEMLLCSAAPLRALGEQIRGLGRVLVGAPGRKPALAASNSAWAGHLATLQEAHRHESRGVRAAVLEQAPGLPERLAAGGGQYYAEVQRRLHATASRWGSGAEPHPEDSSHQQEGAGAPAVAEAAALLQAVLGASYRAVLAGLCSELSSPARALEPLADGLQAVVDAEGAPAGPRGLFMNTAGLLFLPNIASVLAYFDARSRWLGGWWSSGQGRHFLRLWVGLGCLMALSLWWPAYFANLAGTGKLGGWQVLTFLMVLQRTLESTIKRGLMRCLGALAGGGICCLIYLIPDSALWARVAAAVAVSVAACWALPAPLSRYDVDTADLDYFVQQAGLNIHIGITGFQPSLAAMLSYVEARVLAQVLGAVAAIAVAVTVFPDSGFAKARELFGIAIGRFARLSVSITEIFFVHSAENWTDEQQPVELVISVPQRQESSAGALKHEQAPQSPRGARIAELRAELGECAGALAAAGRQLQQAQQDGVKWSLRVPVIGADVEGMQVEVLCKQMLVAVTGMLDLVEAKEDFTGCPYALPHTTATGLPYFQSPQSLARAADAVRKGGLALTKFTDLFAQLLAREVQPHPMQALRCARSNPPSAEEWQSLMGAAMGERASNWKADLEFFSEFAKKVKLGMRSAALGDEAGPEHLEQRHDNNGASEHGLSSPDMLRTYLMLYQIWSMELHMLSLTKAMLDKRGKNMATESKS